MAPPVTRHNHQRSTAMVPSFSSTSSAAADDFSALSLASHSSPLSSRHTTASPSPSPASASLNGKGKARASPESVQQPPKRRERQTRLQEHLKTVKPGSRGPSPAAKPKTALGLSASSGTASKTLPSRARSTATPTPAEESASASSRPKRRAAQKVVMQEPESNSDAEDDHDASMDGSAQGIMDESDEDLAPSVRAAVQADRGKKGRKAPPSRAAAAKTQPREREISSVSVGIDVEGMNEDEVQKRLAVEKEELMARLAQHGINPQADVLDHALRTLSTSNEKLTVESFLRALSSLDMNRSPISTSAAPRVPLPPLGLTVTVPTLAKVRAKKVTFSTLESPSTPSSSDRQSFALPSPPHSAAFLSHNGAPKSLLPPFAPSGSASPPRLRGSVSSASTSSSIAGPTSANGAPGLFASSVAGMGRVAVGRRTLFGAPAEQSQPPLQPQPQGLLPAFEPKRDAPAVPRPTGARGNLSAGLGGASKLQSWLDDDDSEEEDLSRKPAPKAGKAEVELQVDGRTGAGAQQPEDNGMEIRVGGKSVKVLRKRQLEDEDAPTFSAKGKGKQRAVDCLCSQVVSAEEQATIQCVECDAAFHLACINVASTRQLPHAWACVRCSSPDGKVPTPRGPSTKRARFAAGQTTPVLSHEPTFVASTFSPLPRGNFTSCLDVALAPSPTSSPIRRFAAAPTSPVPTSAKVAIPSTPQFGGAVDPRSDYSPCSPLFYRNRRARLASGVFEGAPFGSDDWSGEVATPDGAAYHDVASTPFADTLNDWHPPSWNDLTMTPSRGLPSSSAGTVWETPFSSSHSRRASLTHQLHHLPHLRTPSQDFLHSLHHGPEHHSAPAQMFAQRLFGGGPGTGNESPGPQYANVPLDPAGSPSFRPGSPLGPKRPLRQRDPSGGYTLPPHAFSTPSYSHHHPLPHHAYPPTPQSALKPPFAHTPIAFGAPHLRAPSNGASTAMKVSHSAPGMTRVTSGLGIGFEEQAFDDLLL
ncbi:hypothetical protein JCM1841_005547 [Sporobolomyces salmonicolor]